MASRRRKSRNEETSYWLSYSDMMAAVLLVFVLIITSTMLQSKKLYEDKSNELSQSQALINQREQELKAAKEELGQIKGDLNHMVGVKKDLIKALQEALPGVKVDPQTGAITFESNILFGVDKSNLKAEGEAFLEEFLPEYINVLLSPQFIDSISEIIIEGHTDTNGTYMHNLELSQERALSVAKFCLNDERNGLSQKDRDRLRKIMTANGKSYSNPVLNDDGTVDMEASRRVEIKFRLKDDETINQMIDALEEIDEQEE